MMSDPAPRIDYYRITCSCTHPRIRYDETSKTYRCCHCQAVLEPMRIRDDQSIDWRKVAEDMQRQNLQIRTRVTAYVNGLARIGKPKVEGPETPDGRSNESAYLDTIHKLEKANDSLMTRLRRAEAEIRDLNSTIDHLKNEGRKKESVDVHGAMESILEYMCEVDNVPERKDTPEKLRRHLHNLTEKTMMRLEGRGITVTAEEPGNNVSGPVEVADRIETEDPALDGKVESNERFGCEFRNGAYPRISNAVRVFHYNGGASKD